MVVALGATAALAVLDRRGIEIPYVGSVGNAAATGLALYALPMVLPGSVASPKLKRSLQSAAQGPLAVALYEYVSQSESLDFLGE